MVQPSSSSTLNALLSPDEVEKLAKGNYELALERSGDNFSQTYPQKVLATVTSDVSGPISGARDGKVDIYDFSRLLSKWGSAQAVDLQELDINAGPGNVSQGKIDLYDAQKILDNWK